MVHGCYFQLIKVALVLELTFSAILNGVIGSSSAFTSFLMEKPKNISKPKAAYRSKLSIIHEALRRNGCMDGKFNRSFSKHGLKALQDEMVSRLKMEQRNVGFQKPIRRQTRWLGYLQRYPYSLDRIAYKKLNYLRSKRNAIQNQILNDISAQQRSIDRQVHARFHEILTHCLPVSEASVEMGYVRIHQSNTFEVVCKPGKTRPLQTFKNWTCDPKWLLERDMYIPSMCNAKILPSFIAMEQEITLDGLRNSPCGRKPNLAVVQRVWQEHLRTRKMATFKVDSRSFKFSLNFIGGECAGSFQSEQDFRVETKIRVDVSHAPMTFKLRNSTRRGVQAVLNRETDLMFGNLLRDGVITNYSIKRGVLLFKAIACPDKATSVQRDERYFESDIPSCRYCDRGMYLHRELEMCIRCPRGWYSREIDEDCTLCPLVENAKSVSADSLADCFSIPVCSECISAGLVESLVIAVSFNMLVMLVILWSFRGAFKSHKNVPEDEQATSEKKRSR
ncbi:hypothetical protein RRG08_030338 [Elysia crispata]|uniref:Tyrosine-protein kinase ephrin type A/B receptor-like domain-containing protein n=1 Tax=Elysia crispata TaxID=231223 RepID=A0AAE0YIL1_9GAST|nr:hypothetical protein RRG08_030338 [Elysia crispata]